MVGVRELWLKPMIASFAEPCSKSNIFLGFMEYELNSLLSALHHVDFRSVLICFDRERHLLVLIYAIHCFVLIIGC